MYYMMKNKRTSQDAVTVSEVLDWIVLNDALTVFQVAAYVEQPINGKVE
jgi:hypothetical protein